MEEMDKKDPVQNRAEKIEVCSETFSRMYDELLKKLHGQFDADVVDEVIRGFHEDYQKGE